MAKKNQYLDKNPNWKGGFPECINCGKNLSNKHSKTKLCMKCFNLTQRGINHKSGLPKCVDCGKEVSNYNNKRCRKCYIKFNKGENHPMYGIYRFGKNAPCWIDGRSFKPYSKEFTVELKEQIRKRDNYKCQNCFMTEEEHLIVIGYNLIPHHIDYNKQNCNKNNLITLCLSCNLRANYNRDYWKEYYNKKIKEVINVSRN